MSKLTNFDLPGSLETVWAALHEHDQSDDVCTAMAWITEALGLDLSTADDSTNGEYVERPEVSQTEQDMEFIAEAARDFMELMQADALFDLHPDPDTIKDIDKIAAALERLGR